MLRSNIAACYLKLQDWKSAVDAATASIECLERCIPKRKDGDTDSSTKSAGNDGQHGVIELAAGEDEKTQLERLDREDSRRRDVQRIRAKALLRRARARTELDGWANLQGAEEDYKELSTMDNLPAQDRKFVQKALRELPPRIHVAREKEMAEMMGKLKEVSLCPENALALAKICSWAMASSSRLAFRQTISSLSRMRKRVVTVCSFSDNDLPYRHGIPICRCNYVSS